MTPEEIKSFLKKHLKIEFYNHRENYREYPKVALKIDDEEIASSVNYDFVKVYR